MKDNLYSINEIVKWYDKHVDIGISDDFLISIISKGIITQSEPSFYDINEVNNFLLYKEGNTYKVNDDGKYILKDNRKNIVEKFPKKQERKPKKFKITTLDGNKLKLIKVS